MQCIFFHTALYAPSKVLTVILRIPLKDGFENNSLWGVGHRLFGIENFNAVALEFCFVDGTVVPISSEAVKRVHNYSVKMPFFAVFDKPLKAGPVIGFTGDCPVNVFVYDNKVVLESKLMTLTKLPLD